MNIKLIAGAGLLAALGAVAVATGSARAASCISPFATWNNFGRCTGANSNLGFSHGIGAQGTTSATLEADMTFPVSGGSADSAEALGFNNNNKVVGTAPCQQGSGTPGCILCVAIDKDTSPGAATAKSPAGVCNQATKHEVVIVF